MLVIGGIFLSSYSLPAYPQKFNELLILYINDRINGEDDYLFSSEGEQAIQYVYNNYLSKPYDLILENSKESQWDIDFISKSTGEVLFHRPNHGLAHTLRTAKIVPIIANCYNSLNKKNPILNLDIYKAQFMMLFSVIGRRNEMGWGDAQKYQQEYGGPSIYGDFKKIAQEGFRNYVEHHPPKIFDKNELEFWAKNLDTGKPGVNSIQGHLMARAHDIDLIRCFPKPMFTEKVKALATFLKSSSASVKIHDYHYKMIVATGDRCMGYGADKDYNDSLFTKCSTNIKECLSCIDSVTKPKF